MTTHADVLASDLRPRARAAAVQGHRRGRRPADPAPRHGRRRARARRPGGRRRGARRSRSTPSSSSPGPAARPAPSRPRDFFVDLFETAVGEGELLTQIRIPKHTGWGAHYEKFVRVAHQWSIVAVAATVRVEGGTIAEARVGLTNMGSTPLRATLGRGRPSSGSRRPRTPSARPARRRPTAPTRRRTSTATPTTASTSPPSSPGARCSPRQGGEPVELSHTFTVPAAVDRTRGTRSWTSRGSRGASPARP